MVFFQEIGVKYMYSVLSLFAGVGGIERGFEQTGFFKTVYANEFDKYAQITYKKNNDSYLDCSDIRDLDYDNLPKKVDVLLAGFPCQAFSVAGYRKGFEDERGNLFFDTLKVIKKIRPKAVFLENVKNLYSHDNGNTFRVIKEALKENGYSYISPQVLNAKDFGNVPQNRERIYIVAFRNEKVNSKFEFPNSIPLESKLSDFIDFETKVEDKYYYKSGLQPFYDILEKEIISQDTIYQWRRKYVRANKSGVVPTLTANMGMGGHNVPLILSEFGIRKLTPKECFKLQGFDDDFTLPENVSSSQLYKQAGNSVVVPVIRRIAENMAKAMDTQYNTKVILNESENVSNLNKHYV